MTQLQRKKTFVPLFSAMSLTKAGLLAQQQERALPNWSILRFNKQCMDTRTYLLGDSGTKREGRVDLIKAHWTICAKPRCKCQGKVKTKLLRHGPECPLPYINIIIIIAVLAPETPNVWIIPCSGLQPRSVFIDLRRDVGYKADGLQVALLGHDGDHTTAWQLLPCDYICTTRTLTN